MFSGRRRILAAFASLSAAASLLVAWPAASSGPLEVAGSAPSGTAGTEGGAPAAATGVRAGLRIGYARPLGSYQVWYDTTISHTIRELVPITLDVGYRPTSNFYVGVFGGVAPGGGGDRFADLCEDPGCDVLAVRFGAALEGHFRPAARVDPWLGFGMGGEIASLSIRDPRGEVTSSARGFDFGIFSFGIDVRITRLIGFGPYLEYTVGVFTHRRVSTPRMVVDEVLGDGEAHGWFSAGLRFTLFP